MTIHSEHPFATPEPERDPVRRFRGRIGGGVSLWTAGAEADRAGLTVSSFMVATGEPGMVLGLIDPDSALADAIAASGRVVVQLLTAHQRQISEVFAGQLPAPGGAFAAFDWEQTAWGPRLLDSSAWLAAEVTDVRDRGWSSEVSGTVVQVGIGDDHGALLHRRGRYHPLAVDETR